MASFPLPVLLRHRCLVLLVLLAIAWVLASVGHCDSVWTASNIWYRYYRPQHNSPPTDPLPSLPLFLLLCCGQLTDPRDNEASHSPDTGYARQCRGLSKSSRLLRPVWLTNRLLLLWLMVVVTVVAVITIWTSSPIANYLNIRSRAKCGAGKKGPLGNRWAWLLTWRCCSCCYSRHYCGLISAPQLVTTS